MFLDGFKFHADEASGHNRVARDVQQRQALVHSGRFWVWNFSWEDIQFRNDPAKIPATLTGETHAQRRNDMARQLVTGDELSLAQSAGSYTSWSLFLEFLARPHPAFWEKISYLYALTLPGQLQPVSLEQATSAVSKLCQGSHEVFGFIVVPPADGLGGTCTSDEVSALTLMTNSSVKERDASGVFLLLSFDDDRNVRESDFPRHWRGFLRLLNRLQFLPLAHVVTVRGCQRGLFAGIPDAYRHFLAGGEPPRPTAPSPELDAHGILPPDFDLAHPGLVPFLRQLLQQKLVWPVIGFELEADGRVAATAETAWPDYQIALLGAEFAADQEAFKLAGWRIFSFGADGLLPQDFATLVTLLTPSK